MWWTAQLRSYLPVSDVFTCWLPYWPMLPFLLQHVGWKFSRRFFCPKFVPTRYVLLWLQPVVKGLQWHLADFVLNMSHPSLNGCSSLNQKFCTFINDSVTLEYREKEQNLSCSLILFVCFFLPFSAVLYIYLSNWHHLIILVLGLHSWIVINYDLVCTWLSKFNQLMKLWSFHQLIIELLVWFS